VAKPNAIAQISPLNMFPLTRLSLNPWALNQGSIPLRSGGCFNMFTFLLMALPYLLVYSVGLFAVIYFAVRLAIRHERQFPPLG
jgi:hypothetical protein